MKIETKIEENISIQGNNISVQENKSKAAARAFNSKTDAVDFESFLKNSDAEKILSEDIESLQDNIPAGGSDKKGKKSEIVKNNKKLSGKNNILDNNGGFEDVKFLVHRSDLYKFDSGSKINIDKLNKEDINFIKACFDTPAITLNNMNPQTLQANFAVQSHDGQVSYKSFDVSKSLFKLIEYSFNAQKPVRLDFNGNSSVILKINNSGKLIAEFVSNDKAMEYVLKSSIPNLKDRLDAEGLPYEEISYKDNSKNSDKRQNKGGNQ